MAKKLKLDIGAGYIRRKGFKRVDIDPKTKPDYLLKAQDLRGINDNSVDEIMASHILEHIPPNETFLTLREWWRVLKPNGVITIKTPDCGWAMRLWKENSHRQYEILKTFLGDDPSATEYSLHGNIFWDKRIERYLLITGYIEIKNLSEKDSGELIFVARKPNE
ncbi:MAG TPA: methyltransferase domain-containing protein [Candidatus Atribacteria bacterium]|nr:methyltransferase domain-containing protein [Candidatus Atribacteria bacterium]